MSKRTKLLILTAVLMALGTLVIVSCGVTGGIGVGGNVSFFGAGS